MQLAVQQFVDDMARLGLDPTVESGLVIYRVTPIDGARAGTELETGVGLDELSGWAQVPPHWVHLPDSVRFSQTNTQPSPKSGWLMHSRQITGWGDAPPAAGWASHVRAVLSEAMA